MNATSSPTSTDTTGNTSDIRHVEKVRAIFTSLSKYISSKQIYASNNPNLEKFASSFMSACTAYFEAEDELKLVVNKHCFIWRDQIVYENRERDESIALLLYRDGIGEISIQKSVTFDEMERFVDIVKDEMHNYAPEVDIVTRLWNADFENISYRVFDENPTGVPGGEPGEGFMSSGDHIEADDHEDLPSFNDKGRIVAGSYVPDESIGEYINRMIGERQACADVCEREIHVQDMLSHLFTVNDEERKQFNEYFSKERSKNNLVSFLEEILDFARIPGDGAVVGDAQGIIECLVQNLVNEPEAPVLAQALTIIRDFTDARSIPDECRPFFKHVESIFAERSVLLSLNKAAEKSKREAEDVLRYYRLLGRKTVPVLCAMLEDTNALWLRTEVCKTIISVAGEDIHRVIGQLDMDKPGIAQNIVYILRELQPATIPSLIRELMHYPNAGVKEHVIELLVTVGNDEAAELLAQLLEDDGKHVRIKALAAVEQMKNPVINKKIASLAFDPGFELRDMDEQERVFSALGRLAGEQAIPQITDMLRKKSTFLFGKKAPERRKKILAIRALEHIRCAESLRLLSMLVHDKDSSVKSMAQRGLESLEQSENVQNEWQPNGS